MFTWVCIFIETSQLHTCTFYYVNFTLIKKDDCNLILLLKSAIGVNENTEEKNHN